MPQRPCLVLTRPRPESERFRVQAQGAGWKGDVIIAPLQEIILHSVNVETLAGARTLVVTSQHAVRALAQATDRRDWVVWAVGGRTAEVARAAGFDAVYQSGGHARALLADLSHASLESPIVHVRGHHVAADIAAGLQANGYSATSVVGYEQVAHPLSDEAQKRLFAGGDLVFPVFSPRSGRLLAQAIAPVVPGAARVHLIAISASARDAAYSFPVASCCIAAQPDADSMCCALMSVQQTLEQ